MNTVQLTDQDLIGAFDGTKKAKREWKAYYIPLDAPSTWESVSLWDIKIFTADNKKEAVRIAREYGARIIGAKLEYVYLNPKNR